MPKLVWVATADIHLGSGSYFVLAYRPKDRVPDDVVTKYGLATTGLVAQVTVNDDGSTPNFRGINPATQAELDAQVARLESLIGTGGGGGGQSYISLDTDGVPYYDPAGVGTPASIAFDTDGVPYF